MGPRLLLLDEPLASLDATRKREIVPYLEKLRDEARVPMVCVTHNAAELARLATSVVRMDAGRVAAVGGTELLDVADPTPWSELRPSLEQGPRFVSCLFQLADNG